MTDIDELKYQKMLDTIRRVIANPKNAKEVARVICKDWFPIMVIQPDGKFDFKHDLEQA